MSFILPLPIFSPIVLVGKLPGTHLPARPRHPPSQDFGKPNEDVLKHHASISELKRNFLEAVPEQRPSEWDKRLSTHSPFRTVGINGQPLAGADGVSLLCTGRTHLHSGFDVGSVPDATMKLNRNSTPDISGS